MAKLNQEDYNEACRLSRFFADLPELLVYSNGDSRRDVGVIEASRREDSPTLGDTASTVHVAGRSKPERASWIFDMETALRSVNNDDGEHLNKDDLGRRSSDAPLCAPDRTSGETQSSLKLTPPINSLGFFRKRNNTQHPPRRSFSGSIPPRSSSFAGTRKYASNPLPCSSSKMERHRVRDRLMPWRAGNWSHVDETSHSNTGHHQPSPANDTNNTNHAHVSSQDANSRDNPLSDDLTNLLSLLAHRADEARTLAMRMDALVALEGSARILIGSREVEEFTAKVEAMERTAREARRRTEAGEDRDQELWETVEWVGGVKAAIEEVLRGGRRWTRLV